MKKLDRFIIKSFIGPFIAILLVVVFILMMHSCGCTLMSWSARD